MKGQKCHLLVDTLGLLLAVVVHRADIDERREADFGLTRLSCLRNRMFAASENNILFNSYL